MEFINKLLSYFNPAGFFRKNDAEKKNINLRFMHGINRISIWMMLVAVIIMILRYFIF